MRAARGFTLVEILVALTLFAVVGGTLLQLFQSGLRTARLANDRTHAVLLARSKLTELQVHNNHEAGTSSGTLPNGYRWRVELITRETAGDKAKQRRLQPLDLVLTISWGDPGAEREFTLKSLLLSRKVDA